LSDQLDTHSAILAVSLVIRWVVTDQVLIAKFIPDAVRNRWEVSRVDAVVTPTAFLGNLVQKLWAVRFFSRTLSIFVRIEDSHCVNLYVGFERGILHLPEGPAAAIVATIGDNHQSLPLILSALHHSESHVDGVQ
jgi:hypothetical protein